MSGEPTLRLFDNPIRVAQARRRMRRRQAVPILVVVGLTCLCAMLYAASSAAGEDGWRSTRDFLLIGMAVLLCYRGAVQISVTLAEESGSGLLDFHRATPTSAWTDAFGYAAGCTAREYAGAALIVPFFLVAAAFAGGPLTAALQALYVVFSTALFCHACGMFLGLTARSRHAGHATLALLVAVTVVAAQLASVPFLALGHLTPLPALASLGYLELGPDALPPLSLFGAPCSHVTLTVVLQGYLVLFLVWAAARRLESESAHALPRTGGLAFFALTTLFVVGPAWEGLAEAQRLSIVLGFFLAGGVALASVLCASLVPSFLESLRAIRRARRFQRRTHWLETGASAWPLVPGFSLLLVAGALLVFEGGRAAGLPVLDSLGSREALLVALACFSFLAFEVGVLEFFRLRWRGSARTGVFLVAFVSLVLPWILGSASSPILGDVGVSHLLFATSPLYAVGVSIRALAAHVAGAPTTVPTARILWSLTVTVAAASSFWIAAWRARAGIVAREVESGDLPSIDAYRTAG